MVSINNNNASMRLDEELMFLTSFKKIFVGYSGGADSSLLLRRVYHLFADRTHALHLNSGDEEQTKFCVQQTSNIGIPISVTIAQNGTMQDHRNNKYNLFRKHLCRDSIVVLGHHQDDIVENVLLRILVKGSIKLSIQHMAVINNCRLYRPLINFDKNTVKSLLSYYGYQYRECAANSNNKYTRNYIRNILIPQMINHVHPNAKDNLLAVSGYVHNQDTVIKHLLSTLCKTNKGVPVKVLIGMSVESLSVIVRRLIIQATDHVPSSHEIKALARNVSTKLVKREKWCFSFKHRYILELSSKYLLVDRYTIR